MRRFVNKVAIGTFRRLGFDFQMYPLPKKHEIPDNPIRAGMIARSLNWLRIPMYEGIMKDLPMYVKPNPKGMEIGGSEGTLIGLLREHMWKMEVAPNYPKVDIQNLPYPDESYDLVLADQVFEHIPYPWKAAKEMNRVLVEGGIAIATSVFMYPLHTAKGQWKDYYRYSPDGFRTLFEDFDIVASEGWGNYRVMKMAYENSERGPEGTAPMRQAEMGDLYSFCDGMNYILTWVIARKKGS